MSLHCLVAGAFDSAALPRPPAWAAIDNVPPSAEPPSAFADIPPPERQQPMLLPGARRPLPVPSMDATRFDRLRDLSLKDDEAEELLIPPLSVRVALPPRRQRQTSDSSLCHMTHPSSLWHRERLETRALADGCSIADVFPVQRTKPLSCYEARVRAADTEQLREEFSRLAATGERYTFVASPAGCALPYSGLWHNASIFTMLGAEESAKADNSTKNDVVSPPNPAALGLDSWYTASPAATIATAQRLLEALQQYKQSKQSERKISPVVTVDPTKRAGAVNGDQRTSEEWKQYIIDQLQRHQEVAEEMIISHLQLLTADEGRVTHCCPRAAAFLAEQVRLAGVDYFRRKEIESLSSSSSTAVSGAAAQETASACPPELQLRHLFSSISLLQQEPVVDPQEAALIKITPFFTECERLDNLLLLLLMPGIAPDAASQERLPNISSQHLAVKADEDHLQYCGWGLQQPRKNQQKEGFAEKLMTDGQKQFLQEIKQQYTEDAESTLLCAFAAYLRSLHERHNGDLYCVSATSLHSNEYEAGGDRQFSVEATHDLIARIRRRLQNIEQREGSYMHTVMQWKRSLLPPERRQLPSYDIKGYEDPYLLLKLDEHLLRQQIHNVWGSSISNEPGQTTPGELATARARLAYVLLFSDDQYPPGSRDATVHAHAVATTTPPGASNVTERRLSAHQPQLQQKMQQPTYIPPREWVLGAMGRLQLLLHAWDMEREPPRLLRLYSELEKDKERFAAADAARRRAASAREDTLIKQQILQEHRQGHDRFKQLQAEPPPAWKKLGLRAQFGVRKERSSASSAQAAVAQRKSSPKPPSAKHTSKKHRPPTSNKLPIDKQTKPRTPKLSLFSLLGTSPPSTPVNGRVGKVSDASHAQAKQSSHAIIIEIPPLLPLSATNNSLKHDQSQPSVSLSQLLSNSAKTREPAFVNGVGKGAPDTPVAQDALNIVDGELNKRGPPSFTYTAQHAAPNPFSNSYSSSADHYNNGPRQMTGYNENSAQPYIYAQTYSYQDHKQQMTPLQQMGRGLLPATKASDYSTAAALSVPLWVFTGKAPSQTAMPPPHRSQRKHNWQTNKPTGDTPAAAIAMSVKGTTHKIFPIYPSSILRQPRERYLHGKEPSSMRSLQPPQRHEASGLPSTSYAKTRESIYNSLPRRVSGSREETGGTLDTERDTQALPPSLLSAEEGSREMLKSSCLYNANDSNRSTATAPNSNSLAASPAAVATTLRRIDYAAGGGYAFLRNSLEAEISCNNNNTQSSSNGGYYGGGATNGGRDRGKEEEKPNNLSYGNTYGSTADIEKEIPLISPTWGGSAWRVELAARIRTPMSVSKVPIEGKKEAVKKQAVPSVQFKVPNKKEGQAAAKKEGGTEAVAKTTAAGSQSLIDVLFKWFGFCRPKGDIAKEAQLPAAQKKVGDMPAVDRAMEAFHLNFRRSNGNDQCRSLFFASQEYTASSPSLAAEEKVLEDKYAYPGVLISSDFVRSKATPSVQLRRYSKKALPKMKLISVADFKVREAQSKAVRIQKWEAEMAEAQKVARSRGAVERKRREEAQARKREQEFKEEQRRQRLLQEEKRVVKLEMQQKARLELLQTQLNSDVQDLALYYRESRRRRGNEHAVTNKMKDTLMRKLDIRRTALKKLGRHHRGLDDRALSLKQVERRREKAQRLAQFWDGAKRAGMLMADVLRGEKKEIDVEDEEFPSPEEEEQIEDFESESTEYTYPSWILSTYGSSAESAAAPLGHAMPTTYIAYRPVPLRLPDIFLPRLTYSGILLVEELSAGDPLAKKGLVGRPGTTRIPMPRAQDSREDVSDRERTLDETSKDAASKKKRHKAAASSQASKSSSQIALEHAKHLVRERLYAQVRDQVLFFFVDRDPDLSSQKKRSTTSRNSSEGAKDEGKDISRWAPTGNECWKLLFGVVIDATTVIEKVTAPYPYLPIKVAHPYPAIRILGAKNINKLPVVYQSSESSAPPSSPTTPQKCKPLHTSFTRKVTATQKTVATSFRTGTSSAGFLTTEDSPSQDICQPSVDAGVIPAGATCDTSETAAVAANVPVAADAPVSADVPVAADAPAAADAPVAADAPAAADAPLAATELATDVAAGTGAEVAAGAGVERSGQEVTKGSSEDEILSETADKKAHMHEMTHGACRRSVSKSESSSAAPSLPASASPRQQKAPEGQHETRPAAAYGISSPHSRAHAPALQMPKPLAAGKEEKKSRVTSSGAQDTLATSEHKKKFCVSSRPSAPLSTDNTQAATSGVVSHLHQKHLFSRAEQQLADREYVDMLLSTDSIQELAVWESLLHRRVALCKYQKAFAASVVAARKVHAFEESDCKYLEGQEKEMEKSAARVETKQDFAKDRNTVCKEEDYRDPVDSTGDRDSLASNRSDKTPAESMPARQEEGNMKEDSERRAGSTEEREKLSDLNTPEHLHERDGNTSGGQSLQPGWPVAQTIADFCFSASQAVLSLKGVPYFRDADSVLFASLKEMGEVHVLDLSHRLLKDRDLQELHSMLSFHAHHVLLRANLLTAATEPASVSDLLTRLQASIVDLSDNNYSSPLAGMLLFSLLFETSHLHTIIFDRDRFGQEGVYVFADEIEDRGTIMPIYSKKELFLSGNRLRSADASALLHRHYLELLPLLTVVNLSNNMPPDEEEGVLAYIRALPGRSRMTPTTHQKEEGIHPTVESAKTESQHQEEENAIAGKDTEENPVASKSENYRNPFESKQSSLEVNEAAPSSSPGGKDEEKIIGGSGYPVSMEELGGLNVDVSFSPPQPPAGGLLFPLPRGYADIEEIPVTMCGRLYAYGWKHIGPRVSLTSQSKSAGCGKREISSVTSDQASLPEHTGTSTKDKDVSNPKESPTAREKSSRGLSSSESERSKRTSSNSSASEAFTDRLAGGASHTPPQLVFFELRGPALVYYPLGVRDPSCWTDETVNNDLGNKRKKWKYDLNEGTPSCTFRGIYLHQVSVDPASTPVVITVQGFDIDAATTAGLPCGASLSLLQANPSVPLLTYRLRGISETATVEWARLLHARLAGICYVRTEQAAANLLSGSAIQFFQGCIGSCLDFRGCPVSPKGLSECFSNLRMYTWLKHLNLCNTRLCGSHLKALGQKAFELLSFDVLDLSFNSITGDQQDTDLLLQVLSFRRCRRLILDNNPFQGKPGFARLLVSVACCLDVEILSANACGLNDAFAYTLPEELGILKLGRTVSGQAGDIQSRVGEGTLEVLEIERNAFSTRGLQVLVGALTTDVPTLQVVKAYGNLVKELFPTSEVAVVLEGIPSSGKPPRIDRRVPPAGGPTHTDSWVGLRRTAAVELLGRIGGPLRNTTSREIPRI